MLRLSGFSCALCAIAWAVVTTSSGQPAAQPADDALARRFTADVLPFLKSHCLTCHDTEKQEAKLDLSSFQSAADVVKNHRLWETVAERLEANEMPPDKSPQPTAAARQAVVTWIHELGDREARRNAGDPGLVLARRLSNAEYDRTIRDLTGVDLRPTREFPVDPANESGFDNSGESLTMSPALLKKYLEAARFVADHVVLKPEGIAFAPHPVVAETDRDKYCVHRIVDFYKRHQIDYADYFFAAWRYQHRAALGQPATTLGDLASASRLSEKYLATIVSTITNAGPRTGPLAKVLNGWRALPADTQQSGEARKGCKQLRDLVLQLRKELAPAPPKMHVIGISDGSQPFVLWRNRQLAESHTKYTGKDPDPAGDLALFCTVFPDAFFVDDRAPYFDPKGAGSGRLLTAGFHLMQGYFRDDAPLRELVLDEKECRELEALWEELNFFTLAPLRQYKDFIFFERAEPPRYMLEARFDFARAEDKDSISPAKIERLHEAFRDKAKSIGASEPALGAIDTYFTNISAEIRWVEKTRAASEASHLEALVDFARRASRRPLTEDERHDLLSFYRRLRDQDGLTHEEAIRDALASVLLSPNFCYRFDLAAAGAGTHPLSPFDLASRLSYFLWSSQPDDELLARAAAGDLVQPAVLAAQTRRMLHDPRVRGLAEEFAGNWLDIRRFEEHNAVDRERFPSFTAELRDAMYMEPVRFFEDFVTENRPVTDLLYAQHTFVNPILAKHYGMTVHNAGPHEWLRVDDAQRYGRGGLLTMAAFLTKNAPGLRTSPVKRGYWVVRRLLGEHIPPPPPEVPELPKDEAALGDLTLPQLLARHREHKACAGCHERFDAIGLTFEGFGPIGERRELDLGGRPIANQANFPDGSTGTGPEGLRRYLHERREPEFVDNLCRKLLSYALGRTLLPSDRGLLENMKKELATHENRFGSLVETIVTSQQFLNKRGSD